MSLERAIQIAVEAHKNQYDKNGYPYITHAFRVMERGKSEIEKICGVLHDVIEDSEWTLEQIQKEGFAPLVITVLELLTHQTNESYEDYLGRIVTNPIAIRVKMNDLEDNMDIKRLNFIGERDVIRLNKYLKAYKTLSEYGESRGFIRPEYPKPQDEVN